MAASPLSIEESKAYTWLSGSQSSLMWYYFEAQYSISTAVGPVSVLAGQSLKEKKKQKQKRGGGVRGWNKEREEEKEEKEDDEK